MSHFETVQVSQADGIAELVLARPGVRNAMSQQMGEELHAAIGELSALPELRAVILRGDGACFSAGGDLAFIDERAACDAPSNERAMLHFYRLFLSVRDLPVPTLAAIHGATVGAGVCLALACDIRLAASDARLGLTFVRLGLHPGMAATYLLPRLVGPGVAADLLLTGRTVDAQTAERIGLVSRVVSPDELLSETRAAAREIASAGPLSVRQTKASLLRSVDDSLETCLAREAAAQAIDYGTSDLREAVSAIRQKRTPVFQGR